MKEFVTLDDGEIIEVESGPAGLSLAVTQHRLAAMQIAAWTKRKEIAKQIIEQRQETKSASYEGSFGAIVATKRDGSWTVDLHLPTIIQEAELQKDELLALALAATGFKREAIDPGLKGTDISKWKPATPLGKLIKRFAERKPYGSATVITEVVAQFAEDSDPPWQAAPKEGDTDG
jgi:hypothetical protein